MKIPEVTVKDPISGYPFIIQSPIRLKEKRYSFHPAYEESFDHIYKETKRILLEQESLYNLQSKKLALGVLLWKLYETELVYFNQFSTLNLSYNFFQDKDLLAKFFFIIPKLIFASTKERKRIPKFRITQNEIGSIGPWVDLCIQSINNLDSFKQKNEYDETFLRINQIYQKWKLYSSNPDKLPSKVLHYLFTCTAVPPEKRKEWLIFFQVSAGSLYLKHKIRSTESVDLFWSLLECIDHIESSDYQNLLIQSITKFLKKKLGEWVEWHPQFLELSLDYKLFTPKKKAIEGLDSFWVSHDKQTLEEQIERKELASTVTQRIAERRALKSNDGKRASNLFSIEVKKNDS